MQKQQAYNFDLVSEADRYFDDSSLTNGQDPRIVIFMGGVAGGKTTIRKQRYSTGYVVIDAAEIFLSLSRGEFYPFPEAFEEPMQIIGHLVALRAVTENRNIVTEIIGSEFEPTKAFIDAMVAIGYRVDVQAITCDIDVAMQRNLDRGEDCISAFYAEPYQRAWLQEAAAIAFSKMHRGL